MMLKTFDNFLDDPERVRQSALRSGFGTWKPNKGDIGQDQYGGVNYVGDHEAPARALWNAIGPYIATGAPFFRITNPGMETASIHSDREYGDLTAIVYLSPNTTKGSGTGFYRHVQTGWTEMPPLEELMQHPDFERIRQQSLEASPRDWQMYRFVEARYNRCVVFDAPLIHCRLPMNGYGSSDADSRMVWVLHCCRP